MTLQWHFTILITDVSGHYFRKGLRVVLCGSIVSGLWSFRVEILRVNLIWAKMCKHDRVERFWIYISNRTSLIGFPPISWLFYSLKYRPDCFHKLSSRLLSSFSSTYRGMSRHKSRKTFLYRNTQLCRETKWRQQRWVENFPCT